MIFRVIAGTAAGLLSQPAAKALAAKLLKARGKELKTGKKEDLLLLAAAAVCGGVIGYCSGFTAESLYLLALLVISLTVAVTDIHERIIPNETVLAIPALTLLFGIPSLFGIPGFPSFNIWHSLIGLAACFFIFMLPALFKKNVGAGDVKLAAAMGFALGIGNSLFAIVVMGFMIISVMFMQRQMPAIKYLKEMVPMGPFLAAAMMAVLIYVKVV